MRTLGGLRRLGDGKWGRGGGEGLGRVLGWENVGLNFVRAVRIVFLAKIRS